MLELERLQDATKLRALACHAFEVGKKRCSVIRSRLCPSGLIGLNEGKDLCSLSNAAGFVRGGTLVGSVWWAHTHTLALNLCLLAAYQHKVDTA